MSGESQFSDSQATPASIPMETSSSSASVTARSTASREVEDEEVNMQDLDLTLLSGEGGLQAALDDLNRSVNKPADRASSSANRDWERQKVEDDLNWQIGLLSRTNAFLRRMLRAAEEMRYEAEEALIAERELRLRAEVDLAKATGGPPPDTARG